MLRAIFIVALLACAGLGGGCNRPAPGQLEVIGQIEGAEIDEASGLAASRVDGNVYWTHNDSGGDPVLYALTRKGREVGRVRIAGARNEDWEDIAAFSRGGKNFLIVGDVGDNPGKRQEVQLYVVEEPAKAALKAGRELVLKPAWVQRVRYADGPRDCESLAVDAREGKVYLLSKRDVPAVLYQVNLGPEFGEATAQRCGVVAHLPQPTELQKTLPVPRGRYFGQPTAMDFSTDGTWAVVLTYGHIAIFARQGTEPWAVALAREPVALLPHEILQAEAVCAVPGKREILATGEGVGAVIYRWGNAW
ncbi:hypothetical protein [Nibricoccus sp. IMCC34717]|uniref:hypothetical protein n=1 Tax=Nibricoccus sp. IMCC34717 TaxID=3034021 RepID=UPI00384ED09F